MLDKYIKFLVAHEKLLLGGVLLVVLYLLGSKYLDHRVDVANAEVATTNQALQQQQNADARLAEVTQQTTTQYTALVNQLVAQNQIILAQINRRDQALVVQQKTVETLPVPEVANQWAETIGLPATEFKVTADGIAASVRAARLTVQQLEQVPVLLANNQDQQTLLANKDQQINKLTDVSVALTNQVEGLHTQILDTGKACTAQIADINAKATKDKKNWFVRGLGVGAGVVIFLLRGGL